MYESLYDNSTKGYILDQKKLKFEFVTFHLLYITKVKLFIL